MGAMNGNTAASELGVPTLADAILDRLVHQAHCLNLDVESFRKNGKAA
jgi:DNA replication protein DnaC